MEPPDDGRGRDLAARMVGRRERPARWLAARHGYRFRVASRDGASLPITMDIRRDRVTVHIEAGVVSEASIG